MRQQLCIRENFPNSLCKFRDSVTLQTSINFSFPPRLYYAFPSRKSRACEISPSACLPQIRLPSAIISHSRGDYRWRWHFKARWSQRREACRLHARKVNCISRGKAEEEDDAERRERSVSARSIMAESMHDEHATDPLSSGTSLELASIWREWCSSL